MANKDLQPPQPEDNRFDSAINRLELMLHYNLEYGKNRRTGNSSELEFELKAELETLRVQDASNDEATLKRLTDERRKRLGLRELPEEPYGHA